MKLFTRPALAVAFGAFILCAETCRHFESIAAWPMRWLDLPIHDWLAGAFLVYGGIVSRRDWMAGRPYLAAAWAFMLSLLIAAFVAHLEELSATGPSDEWVSPRAFVGILAGLLIVNAGGLVATLRARR